MHLIENVSRIEPNKNEFAVPLEIFVITEISIFSAIWQYDMRLVC